MRAWAVLVVVCVVGVIGLGAYAGWNLRDLPEPGKQAAIIRNVDVFDRSGQLIAQRSPGGQFHIYTPLDQMGGYAVQATLAAEDRDFYHHAAVDAPALLRAAATDVIRGGIVEGGSTITQQLVKLQLLGPEQSVSRKMQEAFLAWAMERRYTKGQILEMYLNSVFYGHGAYGLTSATKTYFGHDRSPSDLTPAQAAFLAGLLQAPSGLDPKTNYEGAHARQLYVLHGMVSMHVLDAGQEQQAEQEDVRGELKYDLTYRAARAPHFVDYVMGQVEKAIGAPAVQQGGLKVYTTLDAGLQAQAEQAVSGGVSDLRRYGVDNGALLAVHPSTGEILAWVGSADYADEAIGGQFNIVLSPQQPGSSFKPYVFAAALKDHTIALCTTLQDRPTDFAGYRPTDYDGRFLGPISARRALLLSRNVPAVQVAQEEGMDRVVALAHQMGIETPLDTNLATAIGASDVTMYDQVEAYGVFANQGKRVPLTATTRIEDSYGSVLFTQAPGTQLGQSVVLTPAEAYLVTDVLKDYPRQWSLGWNHQMAGKSGTTGSNDLGHPDAWMMAYGPDVVVGAWAGSTTSKGAGQPTTAYGTNVGSTISARFVNALPRQYRGWYSAAPGGLIHSRSGELLLAGAQPAGCSGGDNAGQGRGRGNGNGNGNGNGEGGD